MFFHSKNYFRHQHKFHTLIMKHFISLSFVIALTVAVSSCGKEPSACFTAGTSVDSLYANQPILFDASCSKDATQFKWNFSDRPDSVYYGMKFMRSFDSIDSNMVVKLTAVLGGRESVKEQTLSIK
ncbi:MAG: hypothetical protein BGO32_04595 [Bacteroidetes bacterium 37-13]|nr:MAG: hypothetical protein BGO32_04595 [Bacteroidetes bacterium 37-13]